MSAVLEVPVAGPDVHAVSIPARTFTGDFWFTRRTDDRLWFALGDVAGKGLNAALVMAMIQEELEQRIKSCARAGCNPATTMQRLHGFLRPLLPRNRFATVAIGWLRDDGLLTIVNGGHCPPLVLRADGRVEATSPEGEEFGRDGIERALPAPYASASAVATAVVEAVRKHANGAREDDLTILVIG
jgi:serine phosphatase RsbU (regulator of sigma subunit)